MIKNLCIPILLVYCKHQSNASAQHQSNNNKVKQIREAGSLKKPQSLKFDLRNRGKAQPEDRTDLPCKKPTMDCKRL